MGAQVGKDILTAKFVLSSKQKKGLLLVLLITAASLLIAFDNTVLLLLILINILYLFSITYKLILFIVGGSLKKNTCMGPKLLPDSSHLPKYSILVPLFKEAAIVPTLLKNLSSFDYPVEKLQILLALEADDLETITAVNNQDLPHYFDTIIVGNSLPKTKAKACNEALKYVEGEIICVYDADDCPDYLQLKKVAYSFLSSGHDTACVQCKLRYFNSNENWLTNMFEIEYQSLFDFILPAASKLGYPIPLGGSSNHFKTEILKRNGGWDEYNITEDADLGLRLALNKYKINVIDSVTHEESPINIRGWIYQRIRWLKGYFHTFFIYTRKPAILFENFSIGGLIFFFYVMGIGPYLALATPSVFLLYLFFKNELPVYIYILSWINLIYGNASLILTSYFVKKRSRYTSIKFFWSYPLYTVLYIVASIIAFLKLFHSPHYWEKTKHGLSKVHGAINKGLL